MAKQGTFKPDEHFRNLKGQQYLEVKWRVVWFRDEHPEGYISSELVEHDPAGGLAVFKARVGFALDDMREVYATGYGSETRKDFADYLEKSETKAIGRALAMLGYGTAQAIELDEEERTVVDSPVDRRDTPSSPQARTGLAMVREPVDTEALRAQVRASLTADPDAAGKLPKGPADMDEAELSKTLAWLNRRARSLMPRSPSPEQQAAPTAPRADELTAYVNDVAAHLESMKGTRGPMTAEQRGTWASLYTRGQALVGPATGEDSRPVTDLKPTEIATACSRFVQSCLAELAGSEVGA